MSKFIKLTTSSEESEFGGLFDGNNVFKIPYFQRPYKWSSSRLDQFEKDILKVVDGLTDTHFLGAVIVHGRKSSPSKINEFDVIDGQQRMTTVFLYLCAAIKTLCDKGEYDQAVTLFQTYIAHGKKSVSSNCKLVPCKEDRNQLNSVLKDLSKDKIFINLLDSFKPKFLASSGKDKGKLITNYRRAKKFLGNQVEINGLDRLHGITDAILEKFSVVQIDVLDPTSGPKIFDSLNSNQEPMTIGELVRNEIFSRVADKDEATIEMIDNTYWQPFYQKFKLGDKDYFEGYFFPYGLIRNSNVTKSKVYSDLRDSWEKLSGPEDIIEKLAEHQDAYLDIVTGTNFLGQSTEIAKLVKRITAFKAPSSTYPFYIKLLSEVKGGTVSEKEASKILKLIEAFLVRRSLCGIEPTGLHAVFKKLWEDCKGTINVGNVKKAIQSHTTVIWPNDDFVKKQVIGRKIYGTSICKYFILEYDLSLGGDQPKDIPHIEHVMPQSRKYWSDKVTSEDHKKYLHTAANLLPLSKKMNEQVSNSPYDVKSPIFETDSMFKSSREFAKNFKNWDVNQLSLRAEIISDWAIARWPEEL